MPGSVKFNFLSELLGSKAWPLSSPFEEERVETEITCRNCGKKLNSSYNSDHNTPCPKCGSTKQDITLTTSDSVELHDCIKGKVKDQRYPSKKKVRQIFFQGDDQRKSDGKWMTKERSIDRDNNKYKEVVTDPETGKVVHHCEEFLSKHKGHGSAKKK